jgi:hypothetical protein
MLRCRNDAPAALLNPSHEKQNHKDDQNNTDEPDAAMTIPVSIAAEAAAESTEQEDYENYNEDQSERHGDFPSFSDVGGSSCKPEEIELRQDRVRRAAPPERLHARPSA